MEFRRKLGRGRAVSAGHAGGSELPALETLDISQRTSAQHWRLVLEIWYWGSVLGRTSGAQHWGSALEGTGAQHMPMVSPTC